MGRLDLNDTIETVCHKMSDGNPGAINVIMMSYKYGGDIDPDSALGGLALILDFDEMGFYGPRLWCFFKDVCRDLLHMSAVLRAVQLGIVKRDTVIAAVDAVDPKVRAGDVKIDVDDLLAQVQLQLPRFGAILKATPG